MAPSNHVRRIADLPPEQAIEQLLGVTAADLEATALQCFRSASLAGPLQPKGADGTLAWIFGTEAFRQQMLPKGWKPSDPSNQPRVVSPDGKHAVTVACGDSNTGNPYAKGPQTRNKRGNRTTKSVSYNARQADLFPVERRSRQMFIDDQQGEQTLWILLFYVDLGNRTVHYELSRPINIGENGKVDDWNPRFIMPALIVEAPEIDLESDATSDIEISITPRL
ncbi:hypothetical protein [Pseudomonas oryzihabitans]|uniref:hypothetical protein n=1 Tax=Pseudomonas oryzihabitans TaxID=47885 RepID=UPI0012387495|nr:hypothetical protein [Pseudomonas oryzihabitans]QEU05000.1 hypothetical protein FOB65_17365 [Pseudomonas oryzihabitans]